jgi:SAM-dependent methyltransferase
MSKKPSSAPHLSNFPQSDTWDERIAPVAYRFNRQYQNQPPELPTEVQTMPIFREWTTGLLAPRIASPFWEVAQPQKNQHCLDIGCGVSFLIYPWRDWQAFFYGQEISNIARDTLNARGSQLNSKLFKGVELGGAHQIKYPPKQFDLAIATGFSCYFPMEYWRIVLEQVKQILKPGGQFVFDLLNPEQPLAEDWAVLETYLGTEVFLSPIATWETMFKTLGLKVAQRQSGEFFDLYKINF